ncbi:hypothetical protein R3P38DRAFT_3185106 [Favolaschia claudopus]|uniref:Uncharacterized protein n=1 Tax=Favolaschia claudopus TaxID=2862362 RepID=A0AAW0A2C7_9AGAR
MELPPNPRFQIKPADDDREQFRKPQPFGDRPKFPYPEAHTSREQPFDIPRAASPPHASSSSGPRPRPRPAYQGQPRPHPPRPETSVPVSERPPIPGIATLAQFSKAQLLFQVITRFPHPVFDRRRSWAQIQAASHGDNHKAWRLILRVCTVLVNQYYPHAFLQIYHPDKNTDMPQEWQEICSAITKLLNNDFS